MVGLALLDVGMPDADDTNDKARALIARAVHAVRPNYHAMKVAAAKLLGELGGLRDAGLVVDPSEDGQQAKVELGPRNAPTVTIDHDSGIWKSWRQDGNGVRETALPLFYDAGTGAFVGPVVATLTDGTTIREAALVTLIRSALDIPEIPSRLP